MVARIARAEILRPRAAQNYLHGGVDRSPGEHRHTEGLEEPGRSPADHTLVDIGLEAGSLAGRSLAEDTGCKDQTCCISIL